MTKFKNYVNTKTGELFVISDWERDAYPQKVKEVLENIDWKECGDEDYSLFIKVGKAYYEYMRKQEILDE